IWGWPSTKATGSLASGPTSHAATLPRWSLPRDKAPWAIHALGARRSKGAEGGSAGARWAAVIRGSFLSGLLSPDDPAPRSENSLNPSEFYEFRSPQWSRTHPASGDLNTCQLTHSRDRPICFCSAIGELTNSQ